MQISIKTGFKVVTKCIKSQFMLVNHVVVTIINFEVKNSHLLKMTEFLPLADFMKNLKSESVSA